MKQQVLHALRFLEIGNMTAIPVVQGAEVPIRNTYNRMHLWEDLHGKLAWKGGKLGASPQR
jgi:inosine-uridine nucleoside N-ribohydrolase